MPSAIRDANGIRLYWLYWSPSPHRWPKNLWRLLTTRAHLQFRFLSSTMHAVSSFIRVKPFRFCSFSNLSNLTDIQGQLLQCALLSTGSHGQFPASSIAGVRGVLDAEHAVQHCVEQMLESPALASYAIKFLHSLLARFSVLYRVVQGNLCMWNSFIALHDA